MSRGRRTNRGLVAALVMGALLVLYLLLTVDRAVAFLAAGNVLGAAFGVGLLVLPVLAVYLVAREFRFGAASARLLRRLGDEGEPLPGEGMPAKPSGRLDRTVGDAVFAAAAAEVERSPDDWRTWFRAGLAYDLCGDRRRARRTIRRAIALERAAR